MKTVYILLACFLLLFGLLQITNLQIEFSRFILGVLALACAVSIAFSQFRRPQ